jgi:hypothetical protein
LGEGADSPGTKIIGGLTYDGAPVSPGTYDSKTSPGFFKGTGTLTVSDGQAALLTGGTGSNFTVPVTITPALRDHPKLFIQVRANSIHPRTQQPCKYDSFES